MQYLSVKNLEKYQPGYKDRTLIWCKVYFKMINADPDFEMLCEIDKWRFIAFAMLEIQTKKPVPLDSEYLRRKGFDLKKRPISLTIQMLHNSVEVRNENVTQIRIEKSRVDKNREDKEYVFCEIEFDKFWIPYPVYKNRKTGKERCKQWFIEQKISADDVGKMIVTLEKQKPEWAKDGNEYIPKPLTWLNAGDWRDGVEFEVKPKAQVATAQLCKYPGCNDVADYYHPEPRCRKHKK